MTNIVTRVPAKYRNMFHPFAWEPNQADAWQDALRLEMLESTKKSEVMKKGGIWSLGTQNKRGGPNKKTELLRRTIRERLTDEPQTVRQIGGTTYSVGQTRETCKYLEREGEAHRIRFPHNVDRWVLV